MKYYNGKSDEWVESISYCYLERGKGMNLERVKQDIEQKVKKVVDGEPKIPSAYLLVHSDKHEIHWSMAHGKTDVMPANADQPYHTVSIAKTFTAMMNAKLVEEGKFQYQDRLNKVSARRSNEEFTYL
jgi:D-alanyl-D-alanine carboxypeptidase